MYKILKIVLMLFLFRSLSAEIINIPDPSSSIQTGIDSAISGDTILVGPGIYDEQLLISGKTIVLASQYILTQDTSFISTTILDGGDRDVVIEIDSTAGPETTIIGFTIQNGTDGIYLTSPINLLNNRIQYCSDGIDYETGSGGLCRGNTFVNNGDDGIDLDGAVDIIIESNRIINNDDDGIEIRLHEYSGSLLNIIIQNNIISGNREDGIQLIDYPDVSDRVFYIKKNLIINNVMAGLGCMSDGNTEEDYEGASIIESIYFINNTLYGNDYGVTGGDNLTAINNIIANCAGTAMKNVDNNSLVSYSNFWNNGLDLDNSNVENETLVYVDPAFIDAPNNDFNLTYLSVCIDIGDPLSPNDPDSTRADVGLNYYHQSLSDFSLIHPSPDSLLVTQMPDFEWQASVPTGSELITYDLYFTADSLVPDSMALVINDIVDSTFTYSDTINDFSRYYWKVLAKNPWSLQKWSNETWTFLVNTDTILPLINADLVDLYFKSDDSLSFENSYWYPYIDDNATNDSLLMLQFTDGSRVSVSSKEETHYFKAPSNWFGLDTLQLSVTDIGNLTTISPIIVTVNPVNDPPEFHDLPDSLSFSTDSSTGLILWDYVSDIETPDSSLMWQFNSSPDSLLIDYQNSSGQLSVSSLGFFGEAELFITVTDDSNASQRDSIHISVQRLDIKPPQFLGPLPPLHFNEDDSILVTNSYWYPYIADEETEDSLLFYSFSQGKNISVISHGDTNLFKAGQNWFGFDTLQLTVTNDLNISNASSFIVSVNSVNDPPLFNDLPDSITIEDQSSYSFVVWDFVEDIETPDSLLIFNFQFSPDSIQLHFENNSGKVDLYPLGDIPSTFLYIQVTDESNITIQDSLFIKINTISSSKMEQDDIIPDTYVLKQNYPNPFNPLTTISFGLPEPSNVHLEIYDIIGKKVLTLYEGKKPPGYHQISWDANNFSSGIYVYRLRARGKKYAELIKKMVLLR